MYPDVETFVYIWQQSECLTEVSVALMKLGYHKMNARRCERWGRTLRETGIKLKRINRSNLPGLDKDPIIDCARYLDDAGEQKWAELHRLIRVVCPCVGYVQKIIGPSP